MSRDLLQQCRMKFGASPRDLSQLGGPLGWWQLGERAKLHSYLFPEPPEWCVDDPLLQLYEDREKLLKGGRVVWAHIVQANMLLFGPGDIDCPALVLYGLDQRWDDQPDLLETIARELYQLKGTVPDDPRLRPLAEHMTNEMDRNMRMMVPEPLCRGRQVATTVIMVHRQHLPEGYLSSGLFPLVVNPRETVCTMILPSRFWADAMPGR